MQITYANTSAKPNMPGAEHEAVRAQELSPRPNIIVILTDDLGYGSVGCYGATKVKTPNMDLLAEEGIWLADANTPCSVSMATRYSLLTGE